MGPMSSKNAKISGWSVEVESRLPFNLSDILQSFEEENDQTARCTFRSFVSYSPYNARNAFFRMNIK